MATRSRSVWRPNARGYYERQIGWTRTKAGKVQQPKFLLGKDLKEAQRRERKIRELWEQFEEKQQDKRPQWPVGLLAVAKKVAKGITKIEVPRKQDELLMTYADRIRRVQEQFPVVAYVPADPHAFEVGMEALQVLDSIPGPNGPCMISARATDDDVMRTWRAAEAMLDQIDLGPKSGRVDFTKPTSSPKPESGSTTISRGTNVSAGDSRSATTTGKRTGSPGTTLYAALRAYRRWIESEHFDPALERLSDWGQNQVRQIALLRKHHSDRLLSRLDHDGVEELIRYWRKRPVSRKTGKPITAKSASNYISLLKRFLKWVHKTSRFNWRKPEDFEDIDVRVRTLPTDMQKKLEQVQTFSLNELVLLMRYGQPMDRLLLLLGLNCGFGAKEIATLLVGETHLLRAHSARHQEILGYETTDDDSFIKRVRRKNGVYGEFILFPITVRAIEWALDRREKQPEFGPDARLLQNENAELFDKPTKSGNRNQQIPNYLDRLIARVREDGNEIHKLSFGKLRKTAGDLIRRFSDGEVTAVFHCRGEAVKTDNLADVYSNRPFGKVFKTIRKVERHLAPVFAVAGKCPFDPQPQAYTKRTTIERIIKLHEQGYPTGQIARAVGVSGETATRHIQRHNRESAGEMAER